MLASDIEIYVRPEYRRMMANQETIHLLMYTKMTMNSYEREFLIPLFDNEVLQHCIDNAIKNCKRSYGRVSATYEEILQLYAKEAARRLK